MLHPISIVANSKLICQQRQTLINSSAHCKNHQQIYQDYEDGNKVVVEVYNPAGLKQKQLVILPYQENPHEQNSHNPTYAPT
jgi:hypothetical protein